MKEDSKEYLLPVHSLAELRFSDHVKDLIEIREFFENMGIRTRNTRLERYLQYMEGVADGKLANGSLVFKSSSDPRFQQEIDWLLYVLREVHELMWILRGLKIHMPLGIEQKLGVVVGGRDFAALDTNSQSRNVQFELRIASYFCQAGCIVDLTSETDVIATTEQQVFFMECKRVASTNQLPKRIAEAKSQLKERMPRKHLNKDAYGCIAVDVTKVAFSHNGLTFGQTDEHSRDVVQEKLISIVKQTERHLRFQDCRNLLRIWFQIHIPSLIVHPPTTSTRLSSFCVDRHPVFGKLAAGLSALHLIGEVARKGDEREMSARGLKAKKSLNVPKGSIFWFDKQVLREYLDGEIAPTRKPEDVVARLEMSGDKHDFTLYDFQMLAVFLSKEHIKTIAADIGQATAHLVMGLYVQRYPYEESGKV